MTDAPRIVFWGTPALAAECLAHLHENDFHICGVVTQPDKPVGRAQIPTAPPVKSYAETQNIPVLQPTRLKDWACVAAVRAWNPTICVVVAYGRIIPREFLAIPQYFINLHHSLLPRYRGAAPVQYALLDGCRSTGITVQHVAYAMDEGDIILQEEIPLSDTDTTEDVWDRCTERGVPLLAEALRLLCAGTAPRIPQDHAAATYAPKLTKDVGYLQWDVSARAIHNRVRACIPWPLARALWHDTALVIWRTSVTTRPADAPPGTLMCEGKNLYAAARDVWIALEDVQPAGKKRMSAQAFCAGHDVRGTRLLPFSEA